MHAFRIVLLFLISNQIFADQTVNNCSVRSTDYSVMNNVDYQPTSSLLILEQLSVMSKETCGIECLSNTLCFTATFKTNTGQCILYFEKVIYNQLITFIDGYVLSVNQKTSGLSEMIPLLSPSDTIVSIWNSGVGRSSSFSSQGYGVGQYPPIQSALVAIDQLRSTTYINYGNTSRYVDSTLGGIGSGFYVITNLGKPSLLTQFRFATGNDFPLRDPFIVSIEGTNGGNLTQGSSWTLIYNGSTGLETDPGRGAYGPFQLVPNTKLFTSYRLLIAAIRWETDCVQYSEIQFYGYLINLC